MIGRSKKPLNWAQDTILRAGMIVLVLVFVFPPCAEYADVDRGHPVWKFIGELYRPLSLWYPDWTFLLFEATAIAVITLVGVARFSIREKSSDSAMS